MVDIASLAIQIDTSDVARAEKDLDRLGNRGATAEKSAKKLGDAYKQASGDVAKVGDASKKSATGLDQLEGRGNAAERSAKKVGAAYGSASSQIEKVGKESKKSASSVNDLANSSDRMAGVARSLGPAVAGMITLESLRRAQQLSEEYTRLQARVERISTSASAAAIAYSQLNDIARRSGSDLGDTVRLWEALDRSLSELGANDAQILRLTDTLQKVGTIGGSSAEEMSNALRQLGQGLASGVIRAEEFASVLEGMPELASQLAKGLGVPFADLRQLMLDGKLTAEEVLSALQKQAFEVDREFAKLPRTVAQAGTALRNDLGGALSELDKTIGASSNLANLIDALSKGIRFTAGDFTDQEKLNKLVAERAALEQRYEQAKRRTLLSSKEQAVFEEGLKRINGEIVEIQDRRIAQLTDEGKQLQSNKAATNEGLVGLREQAKLAGMSALEREKYVAVQKLGANATAEERAEAEKLAAETYRLNEARKGSLAGTNQQAQAFQRLMDSLDPAAAAQRRYNEELEQLKTNLSGDQLAKAIDRLNHAIDGADATGPSDFIEDYRKELQRLEDQLDPVGKATDQYRKDVERLDDAMARGEIGAERHAQLLGELEKQYKENTRATSDWAKWTEGALDRVDSAFADAWRNIGDGFSSFRDSLTNAFKQMLAELAHMAITRPIVMQIGAALGIGGGAGQAVSMMGGGSAGGINYGQLASYGQSAYSALTGWGQAAYTGWQNGGVTGAYNGVTGYYGDLASSAYNTVSGALGYGNGANVAGYTGQAYANWAAGGSQAIGASQAGYTGAQYSAWVGQQNAAATAGTYAPWLSAASGAYMGYQQSGAKGAVAGGVGGWGGAKLGASAGSYFGPIGSAVGAVIGGILGATVGSSVFGGDWETRNSGLAFSAKDGEFIGQAYEDQKKKGGLFSSDKKRTRYSALDEETATALQEAYDATEEGVASIFESLSLSVEEGSLAGLQLARKKISTKGKTEEEIQQAIAEWFGSAADAMTAELNKVFNTGLDLDLEGMQAFVGNLTGVNEVLRYLDVEMYDASVAGGKLAEALSAAAGGLEALATNSQTYYDAFFSAEEKTADTIDAVTRAFESADVELAASREAYRAMVEDIDLTTEAGREMFATLMQLSGQAAQYFSIVEQQAAEALARAAAAEQALINGYADAVGIAQNAFSRLQQSISAEVGQLQSQYQAAQASANGLLQLSNSLQSALRSMRLESEQFDRGRRRQAQAQLSGALAFGRAGGDLSDLDMSDALSELGRDSTQFYGSFEEYARDYWKTANDINSLDQLTGKQLSVEEKTLAALENQFAYFDQMLADAQREMDILLGIDSSVLSVAHALANFQKATSVATGTPKTNSQSVASAYVEVLGRTAEADGLQFWTEQLASGAVTQAGLKAAMAQGALNFDSGSYTGPVSQADIEASKKAAAKYLGLPGYAVGGYTGAGGKLDPAGIVHKGEVVWSQSDIAKWGGVGAVEAMRKAGPELEVTGPSRIYNASQTAAMLGGGGDTAQAIASLQQSVERQGDALRSIAKHTMKTAKYTEYLERFDVDGLPKERGAA